MSSLNRIYLNILFFRGLILLCICTDIYAATLSISITDPEGEPVQDAVVYVESIEGPGKFNPEEVFIKQENKIFNPFVTVATVGSTARFPNLDGIGHHVYSFSPARPFQLPLSEARQSDPVILDKPGVITVGCNIHDWMVAYIYVVETDYYAISDTGGTAEISGLPEGSYQINVWHPGIESGVKMVRELAVNGDQDRYFETAIRIKPKFLWYPEPPENRELEY